MCTSAFYTVQSRTEFSVQLASSLPLTHSTLRLDVNFRETRVRFGGAKREMSGELHNRIMVFEGVVPVDLCMYVY